MKTPILALAGISLLAGTAALAQPGDRNPGPMTRAEVSQKAAERFQRMDMNSDANSESRASTPTATARSARPNAKPRVKPGRNVAPSGWPNADRAPMRVNVAGVASIIAGCVAGIAAAA